MTMRFSLLAASAVLAFATTAAFAATPQSAATPAAAKTLTPQQQRMSDCNKQATGMKGTDRKTFMSTCLKGKSTAAATPAAAAPTSAKQTQQQKMTSCNADAKTKALAGAARKTFMSSCLKGDAAAAPATH